jgi:hypothetical protein
MPEHTQPELPLEFAGEGRNGRSAGLPAHPESLTRHDPYTNRRFIDMMEHPDNADVVRAFTVGLAINDPERPANPLAATLAAQAAAVSDAGGGTSTPPPRPHVGAGDTDRRRPLGHYEGDDDVLAGVDRDGDIFRASFLIGHCDDHGTEAAMVLRATAGGYLLPVEELPAFIGWLQGRLRKFRDGGEVAK